MTRRHLLPLHRTTKTCRTLVAAALPVVAFVGFAGWARATNEQATPKKPPIPAKITDLAWLEGHWTTSFEENELHAIWGPPVRDCVMASFCWLKDGKSWMYELLTIAEEGDTIVFRFKHFTRELHGWEEKDKALTLVLVKLDENLAEFENPGDGTPGRMVYRKETPTRLTVRVDGVKTGSGFEVRYEKEE